jgi:hypothetical protein
MTPNIGSADRIVRLVIGLALLSLVVLVDGNLRWVGLIGLVPLATAFVRWCPAYNLFGLDTRTPHDRVAPQG